MKCETLTINPIPKKPNRRTVIGAVPRGTGKMRVAKLRVGTLRVEVRAKRASIWLKCETSECASRLLKDRRWQLESISRTCCRLS